MLRRVFLSHVDWFFESILVRAQGRTYGLLQVAKKTVKVMVVGNPCNTNALIAMRNAPSIPKENFHALTRLDENRAKFQLANKAGVFFTSVDRVAVWGNHSTTQVCFSGGLHPHIAQAADIPWDSRCATCNNRQTSNISSAFFVASRLVCSDS